MTETKRKIILGVILGVAVIWGYSNEPWKREKPEPSTQTLAHVATSIDTATNRLTENAQTKAAINATKVTEAQLAHIRDAKWRVDPFFKFSNMQSVAGPKQTDVHRATYQLKGIVYNQTSSMAFMNNQTVREGDIIDGATVVKIERRSVTLRRGSKIFTVKVNRG